MAEARKDRAIFGHVNIKMIADGLEVHHVGEISGPPR
jgi:hypothetical protein